MATNLKVLKVSTEIKGLREIERKLRDDYKQMLRDTQDEITEKAKDIIRFHIEDTGAVASSNLLESVTDRFVSTPSARRYTNEIFFEGSAATYAGFAEYGRNAGKNPPVGHIRAWMIDKDIDLDRLFWIVRNIGSKGSKGKGFMKLARPEIKEMQIDVVQRNIENFKSRFR